ncbi:MAG: AAA family ATPase [Planctomycetes bacterium]|nr:AAA family ATPase [Planctomycetota bacterium]
MRTIAVLNQKGGVGKTTTVANTAAALAAMGSKVVAIDLDPQAHLTIHLGLEPQTIRTGSYKVLTQSAKVGQEILLTRLNLWLLPANINLVGAETELVSVVGRETILREGLEEVEDEFDYCFIDCPPSLGLLTLNALAAAQEVLIPLQPHFLALQGFGKLLQTIELVNRRINPDLKVEGVLLCMFDTRASLPSEVRADIEQFLENARGTNCAWAKARILPTFIRRNIKLAEAPSYGKTIFEYEQNCHGAEDYMKVAQFIHGRSQATAQPAAADQSKAAPDSPEPPQQPHPIEKCPGREQPQAAPGPIPQTNSQGPPQPNPQAASTDQNQDRPPIEIRPIALSENNNQPLQSPQTTTPNQQADQAEDQQKPQIQIRSVPQPGANIPPSKPAETTATRNPPPAQEQ